MNNQPLDTDPRINFRKPIRWWVPTLLGGVTSPVLFVVLFILLGQSGIFDKNTSEGFYNVLLTITPLSIMPMLVALIWVALFGRHHRHFLQVQYAGLLGATIIGLIIMGVYIYVQGDVDMQKTLAIWPMFVVFYVVSVILSSLVWLIFGRWPKYRNQVIRD